jgi:chaperone modulatory protein CbpM
VKATREELLRLVDGLDRIELEHWVANRWVLPEGEVFEEVDVARVELLRDMRRDFHLDDDALPVVLSLLDQVYSLRRTLKTLCAALAGESDEVRTRIGTAISGESGE